MNHTETTEVLRRAVAWAMTNEFVAPRTPEEAVTTWLPAPAMVAAAMGIAPAQPSHVVQGPVYSVQPGEISMETPPGAPGIKVIVLDGGYQPWSYWDGNDFRGIFPGYREAYTALKYNGLGGPIKTPAKWREVVVVKAE